MCKVGHQIVEKNGMDSMFSMKYYSTNMLDLTNTEVGPLEKLTHGKKDTRHAAPREKVMEVLRPHIKFLKYLLTAVDTTFKTKLFLIDF